MYRSIQLLVYIMIIAGSCNPVVKEYRELKNRKAEPVTAVQEIDSLSWPEGMKAAVCLTYDGGLDSHLDEVIPALGMYGFKGSFYVSGSSPTVDGRMADWRDAANSGHELGNLISGESLKLIQVSSTLLKALDGNSIRSFGINCGEYHAVEDIITDTSTFNPFRMEGPVAGSMKEINPAVMTAKCIAGGSIEELVAIAEKALENGTVAVFVFHAIGSTSGTTSLEVHGSFLQYLDENRDSFWVDTFLNIAKHIQDQKYR